MAIPATELITQYGSPLYVYDLPTVRENYRHFLQAFPYQPLACHYAIVCNKNAWLVRTLYQLGAGIHANTPGDAFAAMACGVPPQAIMYSGTNLNGEDFDYLLAHDIPLNLDALDQVQALAERGFRGTLGLRILIDEPRLASRIGLDVGELPAAQLLSAASGITLAGLHMYVGTNTLTPQRFLTCLERLMAAAESLPELAYLNLGGGFGIPYQPGQAGLDLAELGREVAERMAAFSARRGRPIQLILEPGRILLAQAGSLFMTVVSVKERGGRRFIGVDTTVGNIPVKSVYHPYHRIEPLVVRGPVWDIPTDVCGNTTHSRDFLGRNLRLPHLAPGDCLALRDVGAYGYAMSSHFLNRPRPAEVVLDGGAVYLTTRRETLADLLATQVLL